MADKILKRQGTTDEGRSDQVRKLLNGHGDRAEVAHLGLGRAQERPPGRLGKSLLAQAEPSRARPESVAGRVEAGVRGEALAQNLRSAPNPQVGNEPLFEVLWRELLINLL